MDSVMGLVADNLMVAVAVSGFIGGVVLFYLVMRRTLERRRAEAAQADV